MSPNNNQHDGTEPMSNSPPDKVWRSSLRESFQILGIWAFFMAWTIGYSFRCGYGSDANIELVFGIPSWAFWGVAVPWGTGTIVSIAFATWVIKDDQPVDMSTDVAEAGD